MGVIATIGLSVAIAVAIDAAVMFFGYRRLRHKAGFWVMYVMVVSVGSTKPFLSNEVPAWAKTLIPLIDPSYVAVSLVVGAVYSFVRTRFERPKAQKQSVSDEQIHKA